MSGIKNCKLLIIGLDGISFDLLNPWFGAGELPNLQRLKAEGCSGLLRSVPNLHSAAAWTSMVTGKNPGKHGIYFFVERDREFQYIFFSGADRKAKAIWNILNEKGKTAGVINVPMTFPAEPVDGVMISGLDSPSIRNRRSIHPFHLIKNYGILTENYDIVPSTKDLLHHNNPDIAVNKWLNIIASRMSLCKQLFKEFSFDFFMITFLASDWANHNLWKYCDPQYPFYNAENGKKYGHLMLRIYQKLDTAVGDLLQLAGQETNIMVVSDHGAGKHQLGSYYLTDWLIRNNFMALQKQTFWNDLSKRIIHSTMSLTKKIVPLNLQDTLKEYFPKLRVRIRERQREQKSQNIFNLINWSKTKAYTEFKAHNIWINLRRREKFGIVDPGEDYERLIVQLKDRLLEWKDSVTGQPIVKEVFHKSEIYHGPFSDRAPDLQIWWNDNIVISTHEKSFFTQKIKKQIEEGWSGDHRLNGVFLAKGPKIKKGVWLDQLSIYDITPTALHLFGIPTDKDFDGRNIEEIFCD
jgi:predicted AlkP superfamily phosphohydrolase/phosphomutase